MSNRRCRRCSSFTDRSHYCAECQAEKKAAVERLLAGTTKSGDAEILNLVGARKRVNDEGLLECIDCLNWLPASQFFHSSREPTAIPLKSRCKACDTVARRNYQRGRHNKPSKIVQMPRDRPPSADAARQLRAVLDDIGRSLSRLESLAAGHQLTQIGDEAERRTLASQLLRLANAATDLTGRLSGITTGGGHENHERSAEIRNIR